MAYKIITQPAVEPVTLDAARAHCKVDGIDAESDARLTAFIRAARQQAEAETGRALCTQARELVLDAFPDACLLRGAPVQSLVSVKYLDSAGIEQILDPLDVLLDKDNEPGWLMPAYGKAWPATYPVPNAVRVQYVCGYGVAVDVPEAIKTWMLLAIGTLFAQAETMTPGAANSLPDRFWHRFLDPYRIYEGAL